MRFALIKPVPLNGEESQCFISVAAGMDGSPTSLGTSAVGPRSSAAKATASARPLGMSTKIQMTNAAAKHNAKLYISVAPSPPSNRPYRKMNALH